MRRITKDDINIEVHKPKEISPTSWLNEPRYQWFKDAYNYASTQTTAIPALGKIEPEEAFHLFAALSHGAELAENAGAYV